MAPSKYLLRVLSQPTQTDTDTWQKWYTTEHIPDVVNSGVAQRGALFRAYNDFALQTKTPPNSGDTKLHSAQLSHFNELPDQMTFCAVYQTEFEDYTKSENIKDVRSTTKMFGEEGPYHHLAEWDVRVYKLIQTYDPDNLGECMSGSSRRSIV